MKKIFVGGRGSGKTHKLCDMISTDITTTRLPLVVVNSLNDKNFFITSYGTRNCRKQVEKHIKTYDELKTCGSLPMYDCIYWDEMINQHNTDSKREAFKRLNMLNKEVFVATGTITDSQQEAKIMTFLYDNNDWDIGTIQ